MNLGALMLDLVTTELSVDERELLSAQQVGGVILFSRNYQSPEQLSSLIGDIRAVRSDLIIAVDHEGGRVQRFRDGFTRMPPMASLGNLYKTTPSAALALAHDAGWMIASELTAFDIDLSFAPVLDLDLGKSDVIGDRAFAADVDTLCELAGEFIVGMHRGGMVATGKHFPGHGGVTADSHTDIPIDERELSALQALDLEPFARLASQLDAMMPAHVIYSRVDAMPAGFSKFWIDDLLRGQLGFEGVVFSDDLSMEGASVAGGLAQRAEAALLAGCDMVLVCNNRSGAREVLDHLQSSGHRGSPRLKKLKHQGRVGKHFTKDVHWQQAREALESLLSG